MKMASLAVPFLLIGQAFAAPKMAALIVDGQNNHDWKSTSPLLKRILDGTGRFEVEVLTTPPKGGDFSQIHPQFSKYKLAISNYNDFGGTVWPDEVRAQFEQYMRNGGGFVSYHAADNAFPDWHEFNLMVGIGGWEGRNEKSGPFWYYKDDKLVSDPAPGNAGNHGARNPFKIVVRDPNHPITKGLPKEWMHVGDELYSKMRGPGEHMDVLATAFSDPGN